MYSSKSKWRNKFSVTPIYTMIKKNVQSKIIICRKKKKVTVLNNGQGFIGYP